MTEISDQELIALSRAIQGRFGLDFTNYEPKSLKRGFSRLISKFNLQSLLGLWQLIMQDKDLFPQWVDELTVGLTEMFRNPEAWVFIRDDLITQYESKFRVDIWHAGCSSGEEIHTMGILLKEGGNLPKTKALATDLSGKALAKAQKGVYSKMLYDKYLKSYQKFNPGGNFDNYFSNNEDTVKAIPNISSHVTFRKHNLVSDPEPVNRKFDIIFCRNVMIYFDEALKMKVLKMFHEKLNDNGYLIIGYYDLIPKDSAYLFSTYNGVSKIYKKIQE